MNGGEYDFDQAARAGNPASYVAALNDPELKALYLYAAAMIKQNGRHAGFPADVAHYCTLALRDRHLKNIPCSPPC
jgi:hypothetical protein